MKGILISTFEQCSNQSCAVINILDDQQLEEVESFHIELQNDIIYSLQYILYIAYNQSIKCNNSNYKWYAIVCSLMNIYLCVI